MKKKISNTISVDFKNVIGPVNPVHGVGQPPILGWNDFSMFHYLKEAGIPYSRLHDTGGPFGKNLYVDIPNLFRDFDANPYDPNNYDFTFTDKLMEALVANDIEPYFRLGVTIENQCTVKAYRIYPPKDNLQWARICEGIIRHYTEGWGNGYKMKISHWEIWNEPDNMPDPMTNMMWRGTFPQYLALYETASKYLKGLFPHLKIGGYASCGLYALTVLDTATEEDYTPYYRNRYEYYMKCFLEFVKFAAERKCPLDFFSFHCYDIVSSAVKQIAFIRKTLDDAGFKDTEMSLNEWEADKGSVGSMKKATYITAMIIGMQNTGVINDAELYDGRCGISDYSPLFDPNTNTPRKAYYCLKAFNELYKRGKAVAVSGAPQGLWISAATGRARKDGSGAVLLANISGKEQPLKFDFGGKAPVACFIVDEEHNLEEIPLPTILKDDSVLLITVK